MLPTEALARVATAAALVALGAAARALGGVKREDGGAMLRVIFNVTLPAVLLSTFATLPLGGAGGAATAAVVAASVAQAAALGVASTFTWDSPRRPRRLAALLAGSSMGLNLGLFCYPFAEAVWGAPGLQTTVLFDLANQGVLLIACYLAFWARCDGGVAGRGGAGAAILRRLANPCLIALYGAAALRAAGGAIPGPLAALLTPLAEANKPLALLALGVLLDLSPPRGQLATVAAVLGVRLSISLAAAAAAATLLSGILSPATLAVMAAAMTAPVPMLTLTYSQEFGCYVSLAALLVNISNAVSFALLVGIVQISAVAPELLAPAAAAGAAVAAVAGLLGAASARRSGAMREPQPARAAMRAHSSGSGWPQRQATPLQASGMRGNVLSLRLAPRLAARASPVAAARPAPAAMRDAVRRRASHAAVAARLVACR